jgi:hypothetical protein
MADPGSPCGAVTRRLPRPSGKRSSRAISSASAYSALAIGDFSHALSVGEAAASAPAGSAQEPRFAIELHENLRLQFTLCFPLGVGVFIRSSKRVGLLRELTLAIASSLARLSSWSTVRSSISSRVSWALRYGSSNRYCSNSLSSDNSPGRTLNAPITISALRQAGAVFSDRGHDFSSTCRAPRESSSVDNCTWHVVALGTVDDMFEREVFTDVPIAKNCFRR